jgi:hypothetical protein
MNITGKVVKKFDIQEGITKQGTKWTKQDVLITQNYTITIAEVIVTGINEKAIFKVLLIYHSEVM